MGRPLLVGTYGTDDPTRATMPFVIANGALERGHEPGIVLMGEAVYLMKGDTLDTVHGVGFPALRELFDNVVKHGVPIYI